MASNSAHTLALQEHKASTVQSHEAAIIRCAANMHQGKLRTKTGCLVCRRRRLKCDEDKPDCCNCLATARLCAWPTAQQLVDKRWRACSRKKSCHDRPGKGSSAAVVVSTVASPTHAWNQPQLSDFATHELEFDLLQYFGDVHFAVMLLPSVSTGFLVECRGQYLDFALRSNGVKDAIVACCASNKYALTRDSRFARLAMQYYGKAVKHVNSTITEIGLQGAKPDNCLLAAVIFLYLCEVCSPLRFLPIYFWDGMLTASKPWGPDQASYASKHIAGAIQIFRMCHQGGYLADPPSILPQSPMETPITRLMAESILYQELMLYMRNPFAPTFEIDTDFLLWMETALQPLWDNGVVMQRRSAILGVPLALYRLILDIVELSKCARLSRNTALPRLQRKMQYWEALAISSSLQVPSDDYNDHLVILFILASSLLLDWVVELSSDASKHGSVIPTSSDVAPDVSLLGQPTSRWQTVRALSLLRVLLAEEAWSSCYLGSWPMLIIGYAVQANDDVDTVVEALTRMWLQTGYGEIKRIYEELTMLWAHRSGRKFDRWGVA